MNSRINHKQMNLLTAVDTTSLRPRTRSTTQTRIGPENVTDHDRGH